MVKSQEGGHHEGAGDRDDDDEEKYGCVRVRKRESMRGLETETMEMKKATLVEAGLGLARFVGTSLGLAGGRCRPRPEPIMNSRQGTEGTEQDRPFLVSAAVSDATVRPSVL